MSILSQRATVITDSHSILSFSTIGSGSWSVWDRYLMIGDKPAYHIGNVCGTCAFFFERLQGATQINDPAYSIRSLNVGVSAIDDTLLSSASAILPDGKYLVFLHDIYPVLTSPSDSQDYFTHEQVESWGIDGFWGMPHHPKTNYYRLKSGVLEKHERFFEFLIPMFPQGWLNTERVDAYTREMNDGQRPTVLTLSVFDRKELFEADENGVWSHVCLAHYIIDGHHKAFAAATAQRPITALSFIALEQGVGTPADAERYGLEICGRSVL